MCSLSSARHFNLSAQLKASRFNILAQVIINRLRCYLMLIFVPMHTFSIVGAVRRFLKAWRQVDRFDAELRTQISNLSLIRRIVVKTFDLPFQFL